VETERYLLKGPSFLHRILPYWAATLIDRLKVMLLPLVTLIYSLAKILPPTYKWRVENRIYRWYKILHGIEVEASSASQTSEVAALKEKIEKVEVDLINVRVPLSYASRLNDLKLHVNGVRERLERL
jgi:hypothetical protein